MKERVASLDGLRGAAILMVLVSHVAHSLPGFFWYFLGPVSGFFDGGTGVQIFFALSGYLITSILVREHGATGAINLRAFYLRRILRIFPVYYLYLSFMVLLDVLGLIHLPFFPLVCAGCHLVNYLEAIHLLLRLPSPPCPDYVYIGHFWSLSMEEQFYWIWPMALLFLLRTRWFGLLPAFILVLPLLRVASYFLFPALRGYSMRMLHTGSDALFSGCLLAIVIAHFPALGRQLMLSPWSVASLFIFICGIEPRLFPVMPRGYNDVLGATLVTAAITLILGNLVLQPTRTWYHRLLETRGLVFLGRISYSLYVWQQFFLFGEPATFLGRWPMNIVAACGVSYLSYRLVELPFIRWKDARFSSMQRQPAPVI